MSFIYGFVVAPLFDITVPYTVNIFVAVDLPSCMHH